MKLYDIITSMKFIGIKNYQELDIQALTCDSTECVQNGIYFCIKGINNDGHNFAKQAIENGAICLVVERYLNINITQIIVDNARSAMSYISSMFYQTYKSKMKFIGVTGTNGKTTTTFIMRQILLGMKKNVGLIGTEGVYINSLMLPASLTTPDPILLHKLIKDMQSNACEYCIMEVSAHAIALNKIDNIYYDAVALTNITTDHLDFFVNMDAYIKCKASLFQFKHAKQGVIDVENKYAKEIAKTSEIDILTIGKDGMFTISDILQDIHGSNFTLTIKANQYKIKTNLIGEYNIHNLSMAIVILYCLGLDINQIIEVVCHTKFFIPGRLNFLVLDKDYNVVIDYAHTPDGIKNVLQTIKQLSPRRIITVFGCGGNRDKTKRPTMGKIAIENSDIVVVTSDNPRDENPELIIDDILRNNTASNVIRIQDRKSAIEYALNMAQTGDIVAILGKGAERYQEIKGVKFNFSDYDVVDEYIKTNKSGLNA